MLSSLLGEGQENKMQNCTKSIYKYDEQSLTIHKVKFHINIEVN